MLEIHPFEFDYFYSWRDYSNKVDGYRDRSDRENQLMRIVVGMLANSGKSKHNPADIFPLYQDLYIDPRVLKQEKERVKSQVERAAELAQRMGYKLPEGFTLPNGSN